MTKQIIIIISSIAIISTLAFGIIGFISLQKQNQVKQNDTILESQSIDEVNKDLNPESDYNSNDLKDLSFDQNEDLKSLDSILNDLGQNPQNPDNDFGSINDLGF